MKKGIFIIVVALILIACINSGKKNATEKTAVKTTQKTTTANDLLGEEWELFELEEVGNSIG